MTECKIIKKCVANCYYENQCISNIYVPFSKACRSRTCILRPYWKLIFMCFIGFWRNFEGYTMAVFWNCICPQHAVCSIYFGVKKKVLIGNQKVKFAFRGGRKNFDLFLLMAGWVSNIYLSWIHELSREGVLIPSTISTVKSRAEARLD